jgi:hypothetical protein
MALKVPLSFKESEKDIYDFLKRQMSASIFIKQLIQKEMGENEIKPVQKEGKKPDLLDF